MKNSYRLKARNFVALRIDDASVKAKPTEIANIVFIKKIVVQFVFQSLAARFKMAQMSVISWLIYVRGLCK